MLEIVAKVKIIEGNTWSCLTQILEPIAMNSRRWLTYHHNCAAHRECKASILEPYQKFQVQDPQL